jgi:hypothetical protein
MIPEDSKSERKQFLNEYPELKEYWEWKSDYTEDNPLMQIYLADQKAKYGSEEDAEISEGMGYDREMFMQSLNAIEQAQMMFWLYAGGQLTGGLRMALKERWKEMGEPYGDFDKWMRLMVGMPLPSYTRPKGKVPEAVSPIYMNEPRNMEDYYTR